MQRAVTRQDHKYEYITIRFNTEDDRKKGVAVLMRTAEWFHAVNKNTFVIRKKELGLFENRNIKYSQIKTA
jgi:hypothetical protein